ncbi:tryptophan synthase beta subunit-like PLP-dependent enzyme [Collybia nuda]|uniref:L-serine ammonia-lyase n=1 Tax=Collybia nuda TaxID=64659 RepID=A0A9P6CHG9_9AGAR|nr:tryptophan synthase beta subunit-like PLP-dependent enzyme [Collybia nuda]
MDNLWKETPLIYSSHISEVLQSSAYLKLENLHPSHSFKYRGISHFIQTAKKNHGASVHLVIASGGNAGLAAACAARVLEVRCSVFLPEGATQKTLDLLRREKAEVIVIGRHYAEALKAAKGLVDQETDAVMVPAYDDQILWRGHSSMVHEISEQIPDKPDAIFCSVGGGGLLGGLIIGCRDVGWDDVPIIALETIGSDCFYHSMSLNDQRFNTVSQILPTGVEIIEDKVTGLNLAHFSRFTSKASGSLGASQPAAQVVKMALERKGGVKCVTVPDELSMQVLGSFADDHKMLVELACSTTLVPAYKSTLFDMLAPSTSDNKKRTVVFVICGGFKISLDDAIEYRREADRDLQNRGGTWDVFYEGGKSFQVGK